jgi:hypothetical protein
MSYLLGQIPFVSVFADGRVLTEGPQLAIYPGPLMPNLLVRTLKPDALAALIQLARDKDLLRDANYGLGGIMDAPDTVLEINLDDKSYRLVAYALQEEGGFSTGPETPTPDVVAGRAAIREFVNALTNIPTTDFADGEQSFEAKGLAIYAGVSLLANDEQVPQETVDWPLADLATVGEPVESYPEPGVRCQVVSGTDLATVLPLLRSANTLTPFKSGDVLYGFVVRPLLPDQETCER